MHLKSLDDPTASSIPYLEMSFTPFYINNFKNFPPDGGNFCPQTVPQKIPSPKKYYSNLDLIYWICVMSVDLYGYVHLSSDA